MKTVSKPCLKRITEETNDLQDNLSLSIVTANPAKMDMQILSTISNYASSLSNLFTDIDIPLLSAAFHTLNILSEDIIMENREYIPSFALILKLHGAIEEAIEILFVEKKITDEYEQNIFKAIEEITGKATVPETVKPATEDSPTAPKEKNKKTGNVQQTDSPQPKNREDILNELEEILKAVVMAEVGDLKSLTDILERVERFSKLDIDKKLSDLALEAKKTLENIMLDKTADSKTAFEQVCSYVSDMQNTLRTENPPAPKKKTVSLKLSPNIDEEILGVFLSAQDSVLEEMEEQILNIENGGDIAQLRRIIHSLKGEVGVLSMNDVGRLCHKTEDYLDSKGSDLSVSLLLTIKDWFSQIFRAYAGKDKPPEPVEDIIASLEQKEGTVDDKALSLPANDPIAPTIPDNLPSQRTQEAEPIEEFKSLDISTLEDLTIVADFISEATEHLQAADEWLMALEANPYDMDTLNTAFRDFHTIKGVASFLGLDGIKTLAHATESLFDRGRKSEIELTGNRMDIIFNAVDGMKLELETLKTAVESGGVYEPDSSLPQLIAEIRKLTLGDKKKVLGEILIEEGKATFTELETALAEQKKNPDYKIGEILIKHGVLDHKDLEMAIEKQTGSPKKTTKIRENIKVDIDRLDKLIDAIGELVIAESVVTGEQGLLKGASQNLLRDIRLLDKITRELQEIGMSMRLVSIKSVFQKMARLVRDLAKKAGKEVNFVMSGEDTELDKGIIDHIGDPLVHMIRNSVDHGIELPDERLKAGKPRMGTVALRAFQKGGNIMIELEDDGKGLDKKVILLKAQRQGLVKEDEILSDHEINQLIFTPGLSTAKQVTDISGRGVGMDVVKKNIETLHGNIVINTKYGKGSTFSIQLPLTMAIMDGLVVKVGSERYIVPTLSVIGSFRPVQEDLSTALNKGEMVMVHGNLVPLFRISRLFNLDGAINDPTKGTIIIVEDMEKMIGILVDDIVGQQQAVIKSLGKGIGNIVGISGGAILADGNISLILDISGVIKITEEGP